MWAHWVVYQNCGLELKLGGHVSPNQQAALSCELNMFQMDLSRLCTEELLQTCLALCTAINDIWAATPYFCCHHQMYFSVPQCLSAVIIWLALMPKGSSHTVGWWIKRPFYTALCVRSQRVQSTVLWSFLMLRERSETPLNATAFFYFSPYHTRHPRKSQKWAVLFPFSVHSTVL